MTPYHADPWLTVYQGDCREVMAQMPAESVHCVVTSPPYWGLRDYGTATWIGGDEGCAHDVRRWDGPKQTQGAMSGHAAAADRLTRLHCICGAVRQDSQLGLEPTPEEFVSNMVAVFREVRRVLRKDGTCWVNLGDSYSGSWSGHSIRPDGGEQREGGPGFQPLRDGRYPSRPPNVPGLKPKDLVGIPWRVAFALQADGWYLRSDIIWSKPNPMPESVTDRPTKAHEYLFLLSKRPTYFYDAEAVREPGEPWAARHPDSWATGMDGGHDTVRWSQRDPGAPTAGNGDMRSGRNLRSVWSIATQPYPGAHFATFPEKLVEPCVKAGTSERGVCPECGRGWRRVTESTTRFEGGSGKVVDVRTLSWIPSCAHDAIPVPATVLDPFAGSGTTGRVAQRLGRRAVLIDLSGEYLVQAMRRNNEIPLGLEVV